MKRKCWKCARLFEEADDKLTKSSGAAVLCAACAPQVLSAEAAAQVVARQVKTVPSLSCGCPDAEGAPHLPGCGARAAGAKPVSRGDGTTAYEAPPGTGLTELEAVEECLSSVVKIHEFLSRRILELCAHVDRLRVREQKALLAEVQRAVEGA